jgi:hypothetical protein
VRTLKKEEDIQKVREDKKLLRLMDRDKKIEETLRRDFPNLKTMHDLPKIGAFVTFNTT